MVEDKENLKDNPFYDAWIKYNNQNYKDDQLIFDEFMEFAAKNRGFEHENATFSKYIGLKQKIRMKTKNTSSAPAFI